MSDLNDALQDLQDLQGSLGKGMRSYDQELRDLIYKRENALEIDDLKRKMGIIQALEGKLAEIEWELERSSYLIQEEPDIEDLA